MNQIFIKGAEVLVHPYAGQRHLSSLYDTVECDGERGDTRRRCPPTADPSFPLSLLPSAALGDFLFGLIICRERDESSEPRDSLARNPCKIRALCVRQFPEIVRTL